MPQSFETSDVILATPKRIYEAWLDSEEHTNMTGGKAEVSAEPGALIHRLGRLHHRGQPGAGAVPPHHSVVALLPVSRGRPRFPSGGRARPRKRPACRHHRHHQALQRARRTG